RTNHVISMSLNLLVNNLFSFCKPKFLLELYDNTPATAVNQSPNPNNPAEYCSTIPPLQQAQASGVLSSPPPTVMVPVGVLKQPGNEGTSVSSVRSACSPDQCY
uniref:Smad anchor for receptor activation-like Smad-binding domain-containing protein n=1 Tax=Poecilia mexicana TaxID=48701 RepID=A0A3B3Y7G6_9TELE